MPNHFPLLVILSLCYLVFPVTIFMVGWIQAMYALPIIVLMFWMSFKLIRHYKAQITSPVFAFSLQEKRALIGTAVMLLVWLGLSGTGGTGYQNGDYHASNALFADLIRRSWPLRYEANDLYQGFSMVYYVTYYLPAAVVGKVLGWQVANAFMFLWTYGGLLLAFGWILTNITYAKKFLYAPFIALLFIFISGLDVIGTFMNQGPEWFKWDGHIEWWGYIFSISSNTTMLFWVPQHVIAPWILTGMLMYMTTHATARRGLYFIAACLPIWSPFASVWICILMAISFAFGILVEKKSFREMLYFDELAVAAAMIFPIATFLLSNKINFKAGWIWETSEYFTWGRYWMIILLDVALYAGFAAWFVRSGSSALKRWFVAIFICILLVPMYRMGEFHDMAMRGTIPEMFCLWIITIDAVFRLKFPGRLAFAVVFLIGAVTPITEMTRSIEFYRLGIIPIEQTYIFNNINYRSTVEQRMGDDESFFFKYLAKR